MAEIDLNEDLVYYFGLFLIKRADDGEATSKLIKYQFSLRVKNYAQAHDHAYFLVIQSSVFFYSCQEISRL